MDQDIITRRLRLRRFRPQDAQAHFEILNDWQVTRTLSRPPFPLSRNEAQAYVARAARRPWHRAIVTHRMIGAVTLSDHLGYYLAREAWGQGLMTEAVLAFIDAYFRTTDAHRIDSGAFVDNPASARVLEKVGFSAIGTTMVNSMSRGKDVALISMVLKRTDWERRAA